MLKQRLEGFSKSSGAGDKDHLYLLIGPASPPPPPPARPPRKGKLPYTFQTENNLPWAPTFLVTGR